jgi:ketosteroid isomerase-like protein
VGSHENVQRLRDGYAAFESGDFTALNEMMADDIVWHVPGDSPLSGDYKGKEEVFGYFGALMQETGGTFKVELQDILANDTRAVALQRVSGDRNGKHLDSYAANVFEMTPDGRAKEVTLMSTDTAAASDFFS